MRRLLIGLTIVAVLGAVLARALLQRLRTLTPEEKTQIKDGVNSLFAQAERRGLIPHHPTFWRDYHPDYPQLRLLEENYAAIRRECLELMAIKEQLVDVEKLGGAYTQGGIHAIQWKSFAFKMGDFVEENCARCPQTAALLRRIPGLYTAFFSVLDPNQYIKPHWGYWRGFLRYHLGIIIPNNNADHCCWLRINDNWADNDLQDVSLVERGEKYYWHEGEGVVFDDTFLHDAANDSNEVRVVLWLDVEKKMPWYLALLNRAALAIATRDPSVKETQKNAVVTAPAAH